MKSRRNAKIASALREQISTSILFELKDPRVKNVTVTHVDVSEDVRSAKISVSIMGDENQQALCLHGLNSARGYLQSRVAARLQTRNTPILSFENDLGVKKSIAASRLLRETLPEDEQASEDDIEVELAENGEHPDPAVEVD